MTLGIRHDARLPGSGALEDWLSEACLRERRADQWLHAAPFKHLVIPDLIRSDVYSDLTDACATECQRVGMSQDQDDRQLLYAPFLLRPAVDFFCGGAFRRFLGRVVGEKIARPRDSIPQLRRLKGPTPAMRPHTDADVRFAFATFFFVHKSWCSGQGGETILFDSDQREDRRVLPWPNLLYGMFFSPRSLHAVSELVERVDRICIYQEWSVTN